MTDLLQFLSAIDTVERRAPKPTPKLSHLIGYADGRLDRLARIELEESALADEWLRHRLFNVWKIVDQFQTGRLSAVNAAPHRNPLAAEILHVLGREGHTEALPTPAVATSHVVGRDADIERIFTRISDGRWLTLTGAGGVGKTTVLREIGRVAEARRAERVLSVECEGVNGIEHFYAMLAAASGLPREGDSRALVQAAFQKEPVLLLLDRLDGRVVICQALQELLAECPELKVLCTSRNSLGLAEETIYELRPFEVAEGADSEPAFTLFIDVLRRAMGTFKATAKNVRMVRRACRLAMGVPLAITIAAGSMADGSLGDLVDRMERSPTISSSLRPTFVEQSISRAIQLLSAEDEDLLVQLSVFAGTFSYEDARVVCELDDTSFSGALVRLQNCGIVEPAIQDGYLVFRLHDAVQDHVAAYGRDISRVQLSHAALFGVKAEHIGQLMRGGFWKAGTSELLRENSNLQRAMRFSIATDNRDLVRQFARGLALTYFEAGFISDFEAIAQAATNLEEPRLTMSMLGLQGAIAAYRGNVERYTELWTRRAEMGKQLGNTAVAADALTDLAWQAYEEERYEVAESYLREAEELAKAADVWELFATIAVIRARMLFKKGDSEGAQAAVERTEELLLKCTNKSMLPFVYQGLAASYKELGEHDLSFERTIQLLALSAEGHRATHVARCLGRLAPVFESRGEISTALYCYAAALNVFNEYGTKDRAKFEAEFEAFCVNHQEAIQHVLPVAKSTPWQQFVDDLLRQVQGLPWPSTQ